MADNPNDPNRPGDSGPPDDGDNGNDDKTGGIHGPQPGPQRKKLKLVVSPSGQEVKFSDMFGFTLTPTHGLIKFGVMQPETGEFVVHTQIALTPQGMVALNQALTNNIQKMKKKGKPGSGPRMN